MQMPLHTFYLLRILYFESIDKKRSGWDCIEDFAFYALLSMVTYKLDGVAEKRPSAVYLNKLSDKVRSCVIGYRTASMTARVVPPRNVADREFLLEEYLVLKETPLMIELKTDLVVENVSGSPEEIYELGTELENVLLPQLEGCYKRSQMTDEQIRAYYKEG